MLIENATDTFSFEIVKVNGKRMTAGMFKQLYQQKPFNDEFELLYDIKGKVNQGKDFVIFLTPSGIRKFETTEYKSTRRISSLGRCLYLAMVDDEAMELQDISTEVFNYFMTKREEYDEDNYFRLTVEQLLTKQHRSVNRKEAGEILAQCLDGEFKIFVENEYKKGVKLVERYNKLIETFNSAPQIFI